jgi:hypothetical protein
MRNWRMKPRLPNRKPNMSARHFSATFSLTCATLVGLTGSLAATAQDVLQSPVQSASFTRNQSDVAEVVQFGRLRPEVGDQVQQHVSIEMQLATSHRQGNRLIEKTATKFHNTQQRNVTTTEIVDGRTMAVLVRYTRATMQVDKTPADTSPPAASSPSATAVVQSVEGKAYHCRREPGEKGRLLVTDAEGRIPPWNEYEIVFRNMETVGRPNPFVEFLAGRVVRIGETITLSKDLADRLFGMGDEFGEVTRFELTLESTQSEQGTRVAVFQARVEAASSDSSQMRLEVEGPFVVAIDTCRAVRTSLSGPIGMSETRGSVSTAHQFIGTGKLAMNIASAYQDVAR